MFWFANTWNLGTLGQFKRRATKSGRGSVTSWTLRIRDFLVFILMLLFFKIFCFCFFNVKHWQYFFIHGSVNDSCNLPNCEAECRNSLFSENQRVFMALRKSYSKIYLNSCLLPSIVILLAVWVLSLTTQRSKFLPQEVQVNFLFSFGCYLMSLMILNVFILRKFLWFFELVNFFILFKSTFCLFSVSTGHLFLLIE